MNEIVGDGREQNILTHTARIIISRRGESEIANQLSGPEEFDDNE
jgi:hypothetical protein